MTPQIFRFVEDRYADMWPIQWMKKKNPMEQTKLYQETRD